MSRVRNDHGHPRLRPLVVISGALLVSTARCAVPFASGHGDGSSSLAPLIVTVLLAYYLHRFLMRVASRVPSGGSVAGSSEKN